MKKYTVALHGSVMMPDRTLRTAGMTITDNELTSKRIAGLLEEKRIVFHSDFDPAAKGVVPGANQVKASEGLDNTPGSQGARDLNSSISTVIPNKLPGDLLPPAPPSGNKTEPSGPVVHSTDDPDTDEEQAVLGNPGKWTFKKSDLVGKSLDELNVMALEKDPAIKPFTDITEAIEFMSQDGNVQQV